jgi:hypothetical protein
MYFAASPKSDLSEAEFLRRLDDLLIQHGRRSPHSPPPKRKRKPRPRNEQGETSDEDEEKREIVNVKQLYKSVPLLQVPQSFSEVFFRIYFYIFMLL